MTKRNVIITLCLLSAVGIYAADVPTSINYQGRIVENGQLVNSNGMAVTLTLYDDATAGSNTYQEVDSVDVVDGLYNTALGDNQTGGGASSLLNALNTLGANAWLGIQFEAEPELTPRQRLLAVPYALYAGSAPGSGNVQGGLIDLSTLNATGPTFSDFRNIVHIEPIDYVPDFSGTPALTTSLQINDPVAAADIGVLITSNGETGATVRIELPRLHQEVVPGAVNIRDGFTVVDGRPALIFVSGGGLMYQRALDADGQRWPPPVTVTSSSNTSSYAELAIINGFPAIAYVAGNSGLFFVRANDAQGSSWDAEVAVLATNSLRYVSLAEVNGRPGIAFEQNLIITGDETVFDDRLLYAVATDGTGDTWSSPVQLAQEARIGTPLSAYRPKLLMANSLPATAFVGGTGDRIRFIRGADIFGATWGSPVTVEDLSVPAIQPPYDIAIVDGFPAVVYENPTNSYLVIERAQDVNGTGWSRTPSILEYSSSVLEISLDIVNGTPAVAYTKGPSGGFAENSLHCRHAADAAGTSWFFSSGYDISHPSVYRTLYIAMADVNGVAAITYSAYMEFPSRIRYIRSGQLPVGNVNWSAVGP